MTRRSFLPAVAALAGAAAAAPRVPRKGRLKQGATRGCFGRLSFPEACREAARLGLKGFDMIPERDWGVMRENGLIPILLSSASTIRDGINRVENHEKILAGMRADIQKAAQVDAPNVIVLSGERQGLADEQGIRNAVSFFNRIKGLAEEKNVTLVLELLNSKVNHPDYQCDHTAWGVEVAKRVNSPRVKLLYDIYHMQIMEGDIIRTVRENIPWIGHFHTAGNPGRNEIGARQELNYRAIAQAIVDTGYTGYLTHEYSPKGDPVAGMEEAIDICDV
jgi:hydroxypyruvate isomerase